MLKLCRSSSDGHRVHRKVETFSSEAKIVRIGAGSFKIFSKPTRKGDRWTILLCVGGKYRAADSNFGEKTASQSRLLETAVSSLDFVYRKLRQTSESPPPPPRKKKKKNDEISQIDFRNQARWVQLLNFIQKSNICAILSFVILNSIQCLVERSNSQRPNV